MHSSLIAWIMRAIPFGTIIMYGALGETVTEKSGNLNLGVPGIMYLGGFAGFASAWAYENTAANPNGLVSILIATLCAIAASMLGGLIYAFLTISLRANQNVTGLALTTFGKGVANFFGVFILDGARARQRRKPGADRHVGNSGSRLAGTDQDRETADAGHALAGTGQRQRGGVRGGAQADVDEGEHQV